MPTQHTITVTDYQQKVLTWLVATVNAERGTNLTVEQFLQSRVPELMRPFELQFDEHRAKQVDLKYRAADEATKLAAETLLEVAL